MSLHDVNGRLIDPDRAEASEHIQYAKRHLHPRTFERVLQTIDEAIEREMVAGGRR
jgi:hypothetical protein